MDQLNGTFSDIEVATETAIPKPDYTKLKRQFAVGERLIVKKDFYYSMKRLVIVSIDKAGPNCEDRDEDTGNRLAMPVKYCFGWPTIAAWVRSGMLEGYEI